MSSDGAGAEELPFAVDAPPPVLDEHSAPFWAALRERRIVVQACPSCERRRFPRMPACPYCGTAGGDDIETPGTGTVYSFIRAHRALTPAYADVAPYAVATVDLDGGGRIFGRVVPTADCAIGLRVRPLFVDHPGSNATDTPVAWTELCFAAAEAARG